MKYLFVYGLAAACEIGGCYSLWAVLRLKAHILWLVPGMASLLAFACLLTLIDAPSAGRAYSAYGAIYIAASIIWMWLYERQRPDMWDMTGLVVCLIGSAIILWAPRNS